MVRGERVGERPREEVADMVHPRTSGLDAKGIVEEVKLSRSGLLSGQRALQGALGPTGLGGMRSDT